MQALSFSVTFVASFLRICRESSPRSYHFVYVVRSRDTSGAPRWKSPRPCPRPGGNRSESPTRWPVRVRSRRPGRCGSEAGSEIDRFFQGKAGAFRTHPGRTSGAQDRNGAKVSRNGRLLQAPQAASELSHASRGRCARARARTASRRTARAHDRGAPRRNPRTRCSTTRSDAATGCDLRGLRQLLR